MPEAGDEPQRFPLPREGRLLSPEYIRVFRQGRSYVSPYFLLFCLKSGEGRKLGIVVKKRSVAQAVNRNRLKRCFREAYRRLRPQLRTDCLLVVLARKEAVRETQPALEQALRRSLEEASVLSRA
ncbi:MAG: ribonuclease P protein component [bacterium]